MRAFVLLQIMEAILAILKDKFTSQMDTEMAQQAIIDVTLFFEFCFCLLKKGVARKFLFLGVWVIFFSLSSSTTTHKELSRFLMKKELVELTLHLQ
jgi:hypothetical protein